MMTSDATTAVRAIGAIASVQTIVTGPPNGPVLFCSLWSVGVCRRL